MSTSVTYAACTRVGSRTPVDADVADAGQRGADAVTAAPCSRAPSPRNMSTSTGPSSLSPTFAGNRFERQDLAARILQRRDDTHSRLAAQRRHEDAKQHRDLTMQL
jgi:hypothetical protein